MSVTSGVYYIRNVRSKTVIDLKDGSPKPGTDTQGWPKHLLSDPWVTAQLWVVAKGSDGTYTIQNARGSTYLDLTKPDDGTPVAGFDPSGSPNQKWVIIQVPGQSYYNIQNKATGKNVDLDNGSDVPGTKVQGWTAAPGSVNQQWHFDKA